MPYWTHFQFRTSWLKLIFIFWFKSCKVEKKCKKIYNQSYESFVTFFPMTYYWPSKIQDIKKSCGVYLSNTGNWKKKKKKKEAWTLTFLRRLGTGG